MRFCFGSCFFLISIVLALACSGGRGTGEGAAPEDCSGPVPWRLPDGLDCVLLRDALTVLHLPRSVDDIDWLADAWTTPNPDKALILRDSDLTGFESLPPGLARLSLEGARKLTKLPEAPGIAGLTALNLKGTGTGTLETLPLELKVLGIGPLKEKLALAEWPLLEKLFLFDTTLDDFSPFEGTLTTLVLKDDSTDRDKLTHLDVIPRSVQDLSLIETSHTDLEGVPAGVKRLRISDLKERSFSLGSQLPQALDSLTYSAAQKSDSKPEILRELPKLLTNLDLSNGAFVEKGKLPTGLVALSLLPSGWLEEPKLTGISIEDLKGKLEQVEGLLALEGVVWPATLSLTVTANSMTDLERLRERIVHLRLCEDFSATEMLTFPEGHFSRLRTLDLGCSSGLRNIQHLPSGLEVLSLADLDLFEELPELPATVHTLDIRRTGILELSTLRQQNALRTFVATSDPALDVESLPDSLERLFLLDPGAELSDLWTLFAELTQTTPYPQYAE